jgi:hypothetical protein
MTRKIFLGLATLSAQRLDHRPGYVLLQLQPDQSLDHLLDRQGGLAGTPVSLDRVISRRMGIFLVRFDATIASEAAVLDGFRADPAVAAAQYDHIPERRVIPDDTQFGDQWQWVNTGQTGGTDDADIDADEAWNVTTGGLTALGDTIVVAIIDDGLDFDHEDIAANVWRNHAEIDGNGIDDDGNGYIDDIFGWNAYDNSPDVFGNSHGLNVAGMVGAVGNNQTGIAGINWNVKLMTIVGGTPESAALASYAYALEQRILYNETNGALGAFVVATNSSWGIDFGQPSEAPLWCAFYDSLGVHGILSAAATSNTGYDVDQGGDLPTACPSEYLLSVTALDHNNSRNFSAWGLTHVDFGAPGDDIFTTRRNNGYGTTSGTSFASPIAAGLVALLYAAPCEGFAALAREHPSAAALYIRDVIFGGVEPIESLENLVRFGGGLNAGNSMELMMARCAECPIPFAVEANVLSDKEVSLTWSTLDEPDSLNARYRPIGADTWDTLRNVTQPLLITGLSGCADYEIEFESVCADTSSGFVAHHEFRTDGCCELPDAFDATPGEEEITLLWDDVLAARSYLLQWRPEGTAEWFEEIVFMPGYTLEGLDPCTYYELRLQTDCDTAVTGFTDIQVVRTRGCGNCIDLAYCPSVSQDASEEVIDSLIVGPVVNHSGSNGGYALFEDAGTFVAGTTYPVWLKPGFPTGETFDEYFRIWIDLDQDGVFEEDEIMLDSLLQEENPSLSMSLTIPDSALAGNTRMRVSMAFSNPFFPTAPNACDDVEFGEVEDYCIDIIRQPDDCPVVDTVLFDAITFTGAFMYWPSLGDAIAYTYRYREEGSLEYTEFATVDTTAVIMDLEKCKTYEMQIMTVCATDTAGYVTNYLLETDCDVAVDDVPAWVGNVQLTPNPATDVIALRFEALSSGRYDITVVDMQGRILNSGEMSLLAGETGHWQQDDLYRYPQGMYLLSIMHKGQRTVRKFIKL